MVPWECLLYKPDNLGSNPPIHRKVHLTHLKASAGVCNTSVLTLVEVGGSQPGFHSSKEILSQIR